MLTESFPQVNLSHKPTPFERLDNLSNDYSTNIWIKRDDCTGLAFGGNKSRQLEYYIGHALSKGADTLLTTGAVQSNHVRTPYGALGYVEAAEEILDQLRAMAITPKCFFLPTGSASTHAGFLLGLLASDCAIPVRGVYVRRDAASQQQRVLEKIASVIELMGLDTVVERDQVICDDSFLAPGYGHSNPATQLAIETLA